MKRFKLISVISGLLCIVVIVIIVIASTSNTEDSETSELPELPKVFDSSYGIMHLGVANSPPAEAVMDTQFPEEVKEITVYRVIRPTVDDEYASEIAEKFGFTKLVPVNPGGTRQIYTYTNGNKSLEINFDGRVVFYERRSRDISGVVPSDDDCVSIAKQWLDGYGFNYDETKISGPFTSETSSTVTVDGEVLSEEINSVGIDFPVYLDGYKSTYLGFFVLVGKNGKVEEVSINDFPVEKDRSIRLKTLEEAFNILQRYLKDPYYYNSPEAEECSVSTRGFDQLQVKEVSLEYKVIGDYLIPAYIFKGDATFKYKSDKEKVKATVDAVAR